MKAKWQKPQFFLLNNQVHSSTSLGLTENLKIISYSVQTQGKNVGAKCMTFTQITPLAPNGTFTISTPIPNPTAFGCS